jgi:hypothetical protein
MTVVAAAGVTTGKVLVFPPSGMATTVDGSLGLVQHPQVTRHHSGFCCVRTRYEPVGSGFQSLTAGHAAVEKVQPAGATAICTTSPGFAGSSTEVLSYGARPSPAPHRGCRGQRLDAGSLRGRQPHLGVRPTVRFGIGPDECDERDPEAAHVVDEEYIRRGHRRLPLEAPAALFLQHLLGQGRDIAGVLGDRTARR